MRKVLAILLALGMVITFSSQVMAKGGNNECATIKDGTIEYGRVGDPFIDIIPIGYDQWGYNYQAHMFNGMWCDYHPSYRPEGANHQWCIENMADVELMMKWSDEWLSNKDCNGDRKLDRGYSCDPENASSSGCPGAWLTNHERGTYEGDSGQECAYNYFVKIVAAPEGAYTEDKDGVMFWYEADGTEIGEVIWGAYAIIQEVMNDPCEGVHGVQYLSPADPGFGIYR